MIDVKRANYFRGIYIKQIIILEGVWRIGKKRKSEGAREIGGREKRESSNALKSQFLGVTNFALPLLCTLGKEYI